MSKQRPMIYLALLAAFGGLLLAGVSIDSLLPIGFVVIMLMMHMGGHGHGGHGHGGHGQGGHEGHTGHKGPAAGPPADSPRIEMEVAGK